MQKKLQPINRKPFKWWRKGERNKYKVILTTAQQYNFYKNYLFQKKPNSLSMVFDFMANEGIRDVLPFKLIPLTNNISVLKIRYFEIIDVRKCGKDFALWKKMLYRPQTSTEAQLLYK